MPNPTALTQRLPRRDASINWHTPHNPTQHTDASVPTLHNFFSQHFLPSNTVINYHHPSSSHHSSFLLHPPSTLLTTLLNFKFSNFFLQLSSFIAHSACCTPYTFQFTFTFSLSIGNSLYFHLPDLVSKKFHPSYLVVFFSFYFSYFTLKLDQFDPFNLGYPTFHHHLFHCARRCVRGCLPNF